MPTISAEDAVRNYLRVHSDPDAFKSDPAVADLQQRLDQSDDPIERLQLHAELAQLMNPDRHEDDFVTHAKSWADEHGISAEAFRQEGVSDAVLRRAGLLGGGGRRRRSRPRVSVDDVRQAIPTRRKTFTLKDIREATGASAATVRTTVLQMVADGQVEELGTDESHSGPGRAPMVYKRAARS